MSAYLCGCDAAIDHKCENFPRCAFGRANGYIVEDKQPPVPGDFLIRGPGSAQMAEACALVNGERQVQYGSPRENWGGIAKVWSGMLSKKLKTDLTAEECALLMAAMKLQRQFQKDKRDNITDTHGYILVAAHCRGE